jgi:hypothetical protein
MPETEAQKPKRNRPPVTITLSPEAIEKGAKLAKYEGREGGPRHPGGRG